jgi:hypothetical protein
MSSILPQYTKSLFRDEVTSEDDRLLGQPAETDDIRATYPPAEGGASSSTAVPETVRTFALPSHLANYELDGQLTLWKPKTAICGREQTRQVRPPSRPAALSSTPRTSLELTHAAFLLSLSILARTGHNRESGLCLPDAVPSGRAHDPVPGCVSSAVRVDGGSVVGSDRAHLARRHVHRQARQHQSMPRPDSQGTLQA